MYVPAKKIRLFFPALIVCFILGILLLNLSFPSFAQTAKAHSHPIIKTHSSSVKTPFGIRNQVDSTNWAGYAVTGTDVSDVVGTYIQPAVSCSSQTTYVATWVGIDGYSSSTVEQTGTLAECIDGIAVYYAWYEFYPSPMYEIGSVSVAPGQVFYAEVYTSGTTYITTLINENTGASYATSANLPSAADNSAEWIVEAPSSSGGVLPLANFGVAYLGEDYTGISSGYATMAQGSGAISTFGSAVNQIDMVNSHNDVISLTSPLSSDGTSFTDTYESGTTSTSTTTTTSSSTTTTPTSTSTTSSSSTTTTPTSTTSTTTVTSTVTTTSTVAPQLVVSISTDQQTYRPGEEALISVSISYGGAGVAASVTAVITLPNGHQASGHVNTGSNGEALFGYVIPRVAGTYHIQVTASASGYTNGVGLATFTVT